MEFEGEGKAAATCL